ncbi:MAG: hypothetical protein WCK51_09135 [Armatimonadota bacterium]
MLFGDAFLFDVTSGGGLTVRAQGIPIIRASSLQYYAPGWTKGYYSSRWNGQQVRKLDANTIEVSFKSGDGQAHGLTTYRRDGNRLIVDHTLNWDGDEPALIELCAGFVWQPPFQGGTFQFGGQSTLPITTHPSTKSPISERTIGVDSSQNLTGAALSLQFTADQAATCFDARNYNQEWAEDQALLWQGFTGIPVKKGSPATVHYEYQLRARQRESTEPGIVTESLQTEDALFPNEKQPPLIPQPKNSLIDWKNTATLSGLWDFPAGRPKFFDLLTKKLNERFEFPANPSGDKMKIDGGMSDLQKRYGGYRLVIRPDSISMYGEGEAGLRNAVYRLAQMAFVKRGKVVVPTGTIEDEPRHDFRGAHLFVGPKAPEFQKRLWENVLLPLGMNKVVLQCERTEWKTLPKVSDNMTMKQADLVDLFGWYRKQNVEPIPLIQSLGHMEWFFAGGANLDLAYNPEVPYTIDPRKPESKQLIGKLWDEVATILKPQTFHFGLDEIDMRGFAKKDPAHVTELWELMIPTLGDIAKRNGAKMMLWGDEGLSPSDAVDATNGYDLENARKRRKVIPKGAMIADWHYRADQNHRPFIKSLQTWKLEELQPIASTWYRPENIRGFNVAADIEQVGTLITTWAGYESHEMGMLKNLKQFEAMVYAADYGWSGRTELIEDLDYRADEVFAQMYAPRQSVLAIQKATTIGDGTPFVIAGTKFRKLKNGQLAGVSQEQFDAPSQLQIPIGKPVSRLFIAAATSVKTEDGSPIGSVDVEYADGTTASIQLLYGAHLRAADDPRATLYGPRQSGFTNLLIATKSTRIKRLVIRETDLNLGLNVYGITYR